MAHALISNYFEADHDRLDSLLKTYQKLKRGDFAVAKPFFRQFLIGLKRHIVWEEDVLFPLFESKSGFAVNAGPTAVMREEHRRIGALLEAIHDKVRAADPRSDEEERALIAVLTEHNEKEENVLYPAIDGYVTGEEAAGAFVAMESIPEERFKNCCGAHTHA